MKAGSPNPQSLERSKSLVPNLNFSQSNLPSFRNLLDSKSGSFVRDRSISSFPSFSGAEDDNDALNVATAQQRLQSSIEASSAENASGVNRHKKKRKPVLLRLLAGTFFYEPRYRSQKRLLLCAKTGDLFLSRSAHHYGFGTIDSTVVQGVRTSTQEALFLSTSQEIPQWNQVGIIVELFPPQTSSSKGLKTLQKYVLMADVHGLKLTLLEQLIQSNIASHLPVGIRPVRMWKRDQAVYLEKLIKLSSILHDLYSDVLYYTSIMDVGIEQQRSPAVAEETSGPEQETKTLQRDREADERLLQQFVVAVEKRTRSTIYSPSVEDMAEAHRAYFLLDANGDGDVKLEEVLDMFRCFLGNANNLSDEQMASHTQSIASFLRSLDRNGDGKVSLEEFLAAYRRLPVTKPNSNLDVASVINAEFVIHMLAACGIVRAEYLDNQYRYFPHSFASKGSPSPVRCCLCFNSVTPLLEGEPETVSHLSRRILAANVAYSREMICKM